MIILCSMLVSRTCRTKPMKSLQEAIASVVQRNEKSVSRSSQQRNSLSRCGCTLTRDADCKARGQRFRERAFRAILERSFSAVGALVLGFSIATPIVAYTC